MRIVSTLYGKQRTLSAMLKGLNTLVYVLIDGAYTQMVIMAISPRFLIIYWGVYHCNNIDGLALMGRAL